MTARRGRTPEEDVELERKLLKDEKQCAEHIMLVDLGNDVGMVIGKLLDELTCWDSLHVALLVGPDDQLVGDSKVKVMELIDKLEVTRRGPDDEQRECRNKTVGLTRAIELCDKLNFVVVQV